MMLLCRCCSWPEDLITSPLPNDPLATAQNVYDALLLNSTRIGHGLSLAAHPHLLQRMRDRKVAIESCPVSNQILGYYPDHRNNPSRLFHRFGVPVVLGSDDPALFGHNFFTVDWLVAYASWGLELADLRHLAANSLQYSAMTEPQKQAALGKWRTAWDAYVAEQRTAACALDLSGVPPAKFHRLLPGDGPLVAAAAYDVHVYGRHFDRALCQEVRCRFGFIEAPSAVYESNWHLRCEAPPVSEAATVEVSVSLDGGATWLPTGRNFTFWVDGESNVSGAAPRSTSSRANWLFLCFLALLFL